MKLKMLIIATAAIFIQSCATLNPTFKQLDPQIANIVVDKGSLEGLTPKQVQKKLGDPMSVGWMDKKDRGEVWYYMMYPIGEGDVSLLSFSSTADNRKCLTVNFWLENQFKMKTGQGSNERADISSCSFQLGKPTYDESQIVPIKKEDKK